MQETNGNMNKGGITPHSAGEQADDSIIDVSDQVQQLNPPKKLRKYRSGVPHWAYQDITSQYDLELQSDAHISFYNTFKNGFLKEDYIDLEDNINYAYTLMFELLDEYEEHLDLSKLEAQIEKLIYYYPEIKYDALDYLTEISEEESDFYYENSGEYSIGTHSADPSRQGSLSFLKWDDYQVSLVDLSRADYDLLERVRYYKNPFIKINIYWAETCRLYIQTMHALKSLYQSEGTSIDYEFDFVADFIAVKHFKLKKDSWDYEYTVDGHIDEFYTNIYMQCENTVRKIYGYKGQLDTDITYNNKMIVSIFENRIQSKVSDILSGLEVNIAEPDRKTELLLNVLNPSRWKLKLSKLKDNYNNNPSEFVEAILEVGRCNVHNKTIKNMFYEASKFIANHDRLSALTLYIHAIFEEHIAVSGVHKPLTKALQKVLFDTKEQQQEFESIVGELLIQHDLAIALNRLSKFYQVKRKKIKLDIHTIQEVQQKHSGTVEILNQYLQDEAEDEKVDDSNAEMEIKLHAVPTESRFLIELSLNLDQVSILDLFQKSNFSISQSELEAFAKSRRIFKNQLIEGINEACYAILDDVLIEEYEDSYTIMPEYFNKILA
jgi:hypothetical protein